MGEAGLRQRLHQVLRDGVVRNDERPQHGQRRHQAQKGQRQGQPRRRPAQGACEDQAHAARLRVVARIEPEAGEIGAQADRGIEQADHQPGAHDDGHVARHQRLDQELAQSGIVKQRLDHDEAVDQIGELQRGEGRDRDGGVAHAVMREGMPGRSPPDLRKRHVEGAADLDDGVADDPDRERREPQRQRQRRKHHVARGPEARRRQPAQAEREDRDQADADEEGRHRRQRHRRPVGERGRASRPAGSRRPRRAAARSDRTAASRARPGPG